MKRICCIVCFVTLLILCLTAGAESVPTISLNETEITLAQGKTVKLVPSVANVDNPKKLKYTWESSDPRVATVSNGTVKAAAAGSATITCSATLENGTTVMASAEVTVTVPVKTLKLIEKSAVMNGGSTRSVGYTIMPNDATDKSLNWKSSDPSVASVDSNGTVTAVSAGKATITAETRDGSNRKAQISVYVPSMTCGTESVYVNQEEGKTFVLNYYGNNWDNDVSITARGNCYGYSIQKSEHEVTVTVVPKTAGHGSILFRDKKDPKCTVSVDIQVTNSAIPINKYILFGKTLTKHDNWGNLYKIVFINNSGKDIRRFSFLMHPYDQYGRFVTKGKAPSTNDGWCKMPYSIKAGKSIFSFWRIEDDLDKDHHAVLAINFIEFSDGEIIYLSENDLCWYSTSTDEYLNPSTRKPKNAYSKTVDWDKYGSYSDGAYWRVLYKDQAEYFGYRHSGYYVYMVDGHSPASEAGLKVKDIIVAIDGVAVADDELIGEKSLIKVAKGGNFTMTVERPGKEELIDLVFERYPKKK